LETLLNKIVALTNIRNVRWIPANVETVLTALALMLEYEISSVFNAYHAATALLWDPDRTVISTDPIYERIPGIKRGDPRKLAELLQY